MNIEEESVRVGGDIVGRKQTAENQNACELKFVKESETLKIRYSPLCRQVGES